MQQLFLLFFGNVVFLYQKVFVEADMGIVRSVNLAVFLKSKRGSQQAIAKALKVKPPTVSEWKSGKRPVPVEHVPVICQILGISEKDLTQPFSPFAQEWAGKPEGQMILKLMPDLDDSGLRAVLEAALQHSRSGQ